MNAAIIIQARIGSTRLPGKVMMDLGGKTVLGRVIERCQAIPGANVVCCAIAEGAENDIVEQEALKYGAVTYRGSLDDVLARYYNAAKSINADVIMRVTSDCPLIDPAICGEVLKLVTSGQAEYAANNMPAEWPHGLDCEALTFSVLEKAYLEASEPFDREHVTTYVRQKMGIMKANFPAPPNSHFHHHRWTLDTALDYAFLKELYQKLPEGPEGWDYRCALKIVEADPQLANMNLGQEVVDTRVCAKKGE